MMIVRKLRIEKGFSQEQLASMAGISTRTLQRIERGANASPETLKCLAACLDVDFASLRKEQDMTIDTRISQTMLSNEEQEAMEYVRDIKAFYGHALIYAIVILGLAVINVITNSDYLWFLWAAFGWGIGIIAHGLAVFEFFNFIFGQDWEKRQIEKRFKKTQSNKAGDY
ncbi:MAG: helix-turn-helix domain-containing protein [Aestuariivita sp.]|nr:helix-turn-helix domain-containing protein [Aestuariivita sp.]